MCCVLKASVFVCSVPLQCVVNARVQCVDTCTCILCTMRMQGG